jgi:hypothetical protein
VPTPGREILAGAPTKVLLADPSSDQSTTPDGTFLPLAVRFFEALSARAAALPTPSTCSPRGQPSKSSCGPIRAHVFRRFLGTLPCAMHRGAGSPSQLNMSLPSSDSLTKTEI